jgi:hypothetical protein
MATKYLQLFPKPLLDDLVSGRWLPVVGAGMSLNARLPPSKKMPLWPDLGKALAEELTDFVSNGTLDAISAYQHEFGRAKLIERLTDILLIKDAVPGEAHKAFCSIPFDIVCTTNFDFLIERQYERTRHPGAAQWLGFGEDHAAAERQRALRQQHCLQVFNRRREMRLVQKARGIVRPCGHGREIPAPRQMLTDCAEHRMLAGAGKARRFIGNHPRPPLRVHIELVEEFAERRAKGRAAAKPSGLLRPRYWGGSWAGLASRRLYSFHRSSTASASAPLVRASG